MSIKKNNTNYKRFIHAITQKAFALLRGERDFDLPNLGHRNIRQEALLFKAYPSVRFALPLINVRGLKASKIRRSQPLFGILSRCAPATTRVRQIKFDEMNMW